MQEVYRKGNADKGEKVPEGVAARIRRGSTRDLVADRGFCELLAEDFPTIGENVILDALHGHPKKASISLCEWAERQEEPAKALTAWAKKNRPNRGRPPVNERVADAAGSIARQMMARKRARRAS